MIDRIPYFLYHIVTAKVNEVSNVFLWLYSCICVEDLNCVGYERDLSFLKVISKNHPTSPICPWQGEQHQTEHTLIIP